MTVKVIAEIGCNYDTIDHKEEPYRSGSAFAMINAARLADAHYVKFQLFNGDVIADSPLRDKLEKYMLSEDDVKRLKQEAGKVGIGFVLTPMYLEAVDIAAKYADMIKIRFKDNENTALKTKAWETGKPVLISVSRPILNDFTPRIFPMYCLPVYPPEPEDFNLEVAVACMGFSSHYPHTVFDLAFAINRCYDDVYIEKHVIYTFVDTHPIDEAVSITFGQMKDFISQLKLVERMKRIRL